MGEEYLKQLSAKSQEAALKAKSAAEEAKRVIEEGRERMDQQAGQNGDKNKDPASLQSNSEQVKEQVSWLQGLFAAISNSLQSRDSGPDDNGDQGKKNLAHDDRGSRTEEPMPKATNIEMPTEQDQAKFTWNGLWRGVSNAVTSVFKAKKTDSQAEPLSEQSSRNSASHPKANEQLPEEKSVAQEPPDTSIFSKIRKGLVNLWRRGAEQNKEGPSTGPENPAKEDQGVYISQTPPQDLRLSTLNRSSRGVSFAESVKKSDGKWGLTKTASGNAKKAWVARQGNNQSSGNERGRGG